MNNCNTLTAGILANVHKMSWPTREGQSHANYYGSLLQVKGGGRNAVRCSLKAGDVTQNPQPQTLNDLCGTLNPEPCLPTVQRSIVNVFNP